MCIKINCLQIGQEVYGIINEVIEMSNKINVIKEKIIDRYFEVVEEENVIIDAIETKDNPESKISGGGVQIKESPTLIETLSISDGTTIFGNVCSKSDMLLSGKVIGDIDIEGHLVIELGEVIGNIKARSIVLKGAHIEGNIVCQTSLDILFQSSVIGVLKAENMVINSLCNGDIYVSKTLHILNNAQIQGDTHTEKLAIDEGAKINGQIKMIEES